MRYCDFLIMVLPPLWRRRRAICPSNTRIISSSFRTRDKPRSGDCGINISLIGLLIEHHLVCQSAVKRADSIFSPPLTIPVPTRAQSSPRIAVRR